MSPILRPPSTNAELFEIAAAFRTAAETLKQQANKPAILEEFPVGCCGAFSVVLGAYLSEKGVSAMLVDADERGVKHGRGHAWLEVNGLVIDLTGDQFPGRPPLYVAPADDWYEDFWDVDERRAADTTLSADEGKLLERILAILKAPGNGP